MIYKSSVRILLMILFGWLVPSYLRNQTLLMTFSTYFQYTD